MTSKETRRKCAKCDISVAEDANLILHRFPKPGKHGIIRSQVWAKYCFPNEDWASEEALMKLYTQHKMLCSKHFDDSAYTTTTRNRLNNFAIPFEAKDIFLLLREQLASDTSVTLTETVSESFLSTVQQEPVASCSSYVCQQPDSSNIMKTPKDHYTRRSTLKELDVIKAAQLTPRKQKLYRKIRNNFSEIARLRQRHRTIKKNRHHSILTSLATDGNVSSLLENKISSSFALMLQGQLTNTSRRVTGRRWDLDHKIMALSIYKRSTACYRLLQRLFCLPSISTLRSLLNKVPLKCGINLQIYKTITEVVKKRHINGNLCMLAFDEMSIRKNFSYNVKLDEIDGYQDHGSQGRTMEPASHALLFMAIGVRENWKQPLTYYLSGNCVSADRLTVLIKDVLDACFHAGLIVVGTVCDNFGVNIRALNLLGSSTARPYFNFKDHEIVTILDTPHLLKCFRNNFMKYNIECSSQEFQVDGKPVKGIAKWSHIEEFYEKDNAHPNFVFAPALTVQHLRPNFKQKMKVNLACQVLSHKVSVGIYSKVATNELPQEAYATAMVLSKMDKLFDLLNADSPNLKRGKKYSTNMTRSSPHIEYFNEMRAFFNNMVFLNARSKPPSQAGFIRTINAVEKLYYNLERKFAVKSISTRRLNQDPLENCFGCIRGYCGSNPNPNVVQFVAALKTSIIGKLINTNKNKNCKDDTSIILSDLKEFLTQAENKKNVGTLDESEYDITTDIDIAAIDLSDASGEMQACSYVCGFMIKKKGLLCNLCKNIMLVDQSTEVHHIFTNLREYNTYKNSLIYVCKEFVETVEVAATLVNKFLIEKGCVTLLKKKLQELLSSHLEFQWLSGCAEHFDKNKMFIIMSTISICIKRHYILKNRAFVEDASKKALKRKLNIMKNA